MTNNNHVIVGAGATGSATAKLLATTGATVKVVTRSGTGPVEAGIELIATDATNQAKLTEIATGAHAIYNCANLAYTDWTTGWPPLADSLLAAAESTGARLVTLSNLYGYAADSSPMKSTDPLNPPSVKGGVRAQMWHDALAAHQAGRVQVTEARASDFIGPDLGETAHMGDRVVPRVLKGKSVALMGRTDVLHSWTALNDVARTLVSLGRDDRALGRAWHVPTAPAISQRDLVHRMCDLAGVEPVKVSSLPKVALRLAGLFMPVMRELQEVMYQFDAPFVIDSQATTDMFGLEATPLDETLHLALASYGHNRESDLHLPR